LEADDPELRTIGAEGFAKLLFCNRLWDSTVMCDLLFLYFSPATEGDDRLRQVLSVFFPTFAAASPENRDRSEGVFMTALRHVVHAPKASPLSKVNAHSFGLFVLSLVEGDGKEEDEADKENPTLTARDRIALLLLHELLANPGGHEAKPLSRILSAVTVTSTNQTHLKTLRYLISRLLPRVSDSAITKTLEKIAANWASLDETAEEELPQEVIETVEAARRAHGHERASAIDDMFDRRASTGSLSVRSSLDSEVSVTEEKPKAPARATRKKTKKEVNGDEEEESARSSLDSVTEEKPAKATRRKTKKEVKVDDDEESTRSSLDSEETEEKPKAAAKATRKKTKKEVKVEEEEESARSSLDSEVTVTEEKPKAKATRKKTKKEVKVDEEEESAPPPARVTRARRVQAAQ